MIFGGRSCNTSSFILLSRNGSTCLCRDSIARAPGGGGGGGITLYHASFQTFPGRKQQKQGISLTSSPAFPASWKESDKTWEISLGTSSGSELLSITREFYSVHTVFGPPSSVCYPKVLVSTGETNIMKNTVGIYTQHRQPKHKTTVNIHTVFCLGSHSFLVLHSPEDV